MPKQIIAIDIDDVLVSTGPLVLSHYNRTYGTDLGPKDLYSMDLRVWGVSDANTAIRRVEDFLETDEYKKVAPMNEVVSVVKSLSRRFELHIVTARSNFLEVATRSMLAKYFPGVFQAVVFSGFFGGTSRSKADICKDIGADIFIDDHLHHVLAVASTGVNVLLFGDYPWNQAGELPGNVHRVKDWVAVEEYLNAKG